MTEHLTEEEKARMAAFSETPAYERDPDQLLPAEAEDAE